MPDYEDVMKVLYPARGAAQSTLVGAAALKFAQLLSSGLFVQAHSMLSTEFGSAMSVAKLQLEFEGMSAVFEDQADHIEVTHVMEAWPAKEPGDVGWAYVSISAGGVCEGIAVVLCSAGGDLHVRSVEWGRP